LTQALVGAFVTVPPVDVLEGHGQKAGGEQGRAEVGERQLLQPGRPGVAGCDVREGQENCTGERHDDGDELELGLVETVEHARHSCKIKYSKCAVGVE
jgi:hypothetical protein